MVLEHLAQNGLIEEDTNEILEDCEKVIHRAIFSDSIEGISISDGVSGIGLYMISRLKNVDQHKNSLFFKHRLKEAIIRCIFSIEKEVVSYRLGQREYVSEKALWEGFSGVLLFLCASKTAKIPYPKIDTIIMDIIALMSKQPKVAGFVWSDISMWFVILYACKRLGNQEQYQKEMEIFKRKLQQAKARINKLDFCEGPFMALLCKLSYKQHGIIPALHLGSLIHHQVVSTLHKKKMPELFSYQKNLGGINIGLNYGVCNMALSLYSLDTENYNWLSVFGLDI